VNTDLMTLSVNYVIARALEEECSLYTYDDLPIDRDVKSAIDALRGQLCDLVDQRTDALERGDVEQANTVVKQIYNDTSLRLLATYEFNFGDSSYG